MNHQSMLDRLEHAARSSHFSAADREFIVQMCAYSRVHDGSLAGLSNAEFERIETLWQGQCAEREAA